MTTKRDPISDNLEELKQLAKDLTKHKSSDRSKRRIMILCGFLSSIRIPAEREAEVVETIGEITIAASGIIKKEVFEHVIEKIRS